MTRRRRRILLFAVIVLILAIIVLRVYYVTCLRGPKIIKKWVPPDDVQYDENDPYAVALVREGYEFIGWRPRSRYCFVVGPSESLRDPGTWLFEYSVVDWSGDLSGKDDMAVNWNEKGPKLEVPYAWWVELHMMHGIGTGFYYRSERDNSTGMESEPQLTITYTREKE